MTAVGEYSDVEYVFEAHTRSMPALRPYLESLWERRRFMAELAQADLRTARSRTALGNLWSVINPLFQAGIYFFLYSVLRSGANTGFLPILIANFFLFGLSNAALSEGGNSIRRSKGLMLNSTFPRALLPVTSVYKSLREFFPAAIVLAVLFPLLGGQFGPGFLVLPLLFAFQVIMNVGIAMLVSTYVVLVPDGSNVMSYVNRLLFFATPVMYPVSLLPPSAKLLVQWQPLFALFACYQAVASGGTPSFSLVLQTGLWAFGLVIVGGYVFLRREREFTIHL